MTEGRNNSSATEPGHQIKEEDDIKAKLCKDRDAKASGALRWQKNDDDVTELGSSHNTFLSGPTFYPGKTKTDWDTRLSL